MTGTVAGDRLARARAELSRARPLAAARLILPEADRPEAAALLATLTRPPHGAVPVERLRFGPPETWRAWHPDHGPAALKLWPDPSAPPDHPRLLARRAAFRHPRVAPLLAWGAGWHLSGWIEGRALSGWRGPNRQVADDVAEGLAALHRAGLHHGDLTPANVVVTPAGRAVLVDWGEVGAGTPGWRGPLPLPPRWRDRLALMKLRRWLKRRTSPSDSSGAA
jgi:hypothetical protein